MAVTLKTTRTGLRAGGGTGQRDRGPARAAVLKVTQTEPSHGFVAWQALVDGYAPKSSNDPVISLQPILAPPKKCKDAKELKERLTA